MSPKLRTMLSIISLIISTTIIVELARGVEMLLLLINIIANIAQIEDFLEKLLDNSKDRITEQQQQLYDELCNIARDIENLLFINKSESANAD